MNELGWQLGLLREIAQPVSDKWLPTSTETDVPYVGLEHISPETPKIGEYGNSSEVISTKNLFKTGDTLFGKLRPYLKKVALADLSGVCSTDIIPIRANEKADPIFLYYLLSSPKIIAKAVESSAGNVMPRASWSDLADIEIEIPPLPEQKKIAEILSGIDMAIEKSIVASIRIRTLSKAVLAKEASKHAKKGTEDLRDACELITKGATPTTYGHKLSTNRSLDSVSFLGGGNASPEGRFIYGSERYCSQEAAESLRRSDLKEGDSLVTIVGYVGNTCIIPKEILPANINQNVALIRADARRLHPKYLNLFLRTDGGPQLAQVATTQAQPSVSLKQVGDLKIYLPSMEEQLHAVKQADSFSRKEIQLERKIDSLRLLKTAVASNLLSGRKRVSV